MNTWNDVRVTGTIRPLFIEHLRSIIAVDSMHLVEQDVNQVCETAASLDHQGHERDGVEGSALKVKTTAVNVDIVESRNHSAPKD